MLNIAVVSPQYNLGKQFIEVKFRHRIEKANVTQGFWLLENGDRVYNVYGNTDDDALKYMGHNWDAMIILEFNKCPARLISKIMYRCSRIGS